jgi:sirohydrochlorin ferrochelatase
MKKAILYIFHGSRLKQSSSEAKLFFESCRKLLPYLVQHYSFLEFASPTIEEAFSKCVKSGATDIAVVPVLLFSAGHAKQDIPNILRRLQKQYRDVNIYYGETLGFHDYMIDVIAERVQRALKTISGNTSNCKIVVIGRGSQDIEMQKNFRMLVSRVENQLQIQTDYCFLTAARPLFEHVLANLSETNKQTIVFVPYFLFTGLLLKGIKRDLIKMSTNTSNQFILTEHIGLDEKVQSLVAKRAHEAFLLDSLHKKVMG